ncbi:MAG: ATP synthase subunit I [Deltaproteobacteria bacterium]|nr:ATP synthase subunit I [Deltaproteobacteria bacterium]
MASPSILRIERLNYGISAVLVLIALITQPKTVTLGLAAGAALTCANFFVLRKLIVRWTTDAAQGKQGNSAVLMLPKMIALMGLVAVSVLFLPIDVIAFAVGYSIFIVSIIVESIYSAMSPSLGTPNDESNHG